MLSLSKSLDLVVLDVWNDPKVEDTKVESGREAFLLLYEVTRSCVSEAILRRSGRNRAIDAAMMPVPGSAVAQIVALTAFAMTCQLRHTEVLVAEGTYD